ncbi:hypothetical protein AAULR_13157, partial [Lacticaseibacillus rhamnosus MTCC 5462]
MGSAHIGTDFVNHTLLGIRQRKWQGCNQRPQRLIIIRNRQAVIG